MFSFVPDPDNEFHRYRAFDVAIGDIVSHAIFRLEDTIETDNDRTIGIFGSEGLDLDTKNVFHAFENGFSLRHSSLDEIIWPGADVGTLRGIIAALETHARHLEKALE